MALFQIDMSQAVEIIHHGRQAMAYLFYAVNIIAADDLTMQAVRASGIMIFTMLNRSNVVPAR